ncbi:unnamed protein product [Brachionus calyciflorus]|uniref:Uncharacterized protein n=1 Tax=Brachionus calyciflorus TaxID=104777 RepID=A0A814IRP1_9BILA|nr:unnamed protein product [Brachionus calyciflorus]
MVYARRPKLPADLITSPSPEQPELFSVQQSRRIPAQQIAAPEQQAAAPALIVLRPNGTINLNANLTLRGTIGKGRLMQKLQNPVPNHQPPRAETRIESDQMTRLLSMSWLTLTIKINKKSLCVILPQTSGAFLPGRGCDVTQ